MVNVRYAAVHAYQYGHVFRSPTYFWRFKTSASNLAADVAWLDVDDDAVFVVIFCVIVFSL